LDYNLAEGTYKYNGLQMGHTKEMAIKYLVDNNSLATSIDARCNSLENDSKEAMRLRYEENNEVDSYDEVAELRKRLMEAEALLKENNKDVEFVAPFNLPEKSKDDESEMTELRERAKALKIPGAHLPSVKKETLLAKIAEAEGK
jgi:hypothetical protein